jgi:UTP--glucose-1-phosphate uridylyltransferase
MATKEQPKEMLPIFAIRNGELCLKPMLHLIFEQLYDFGVRDFFFVVGRGKRAIEDYLTPDVQFVRSLRERGKSDQALQLEEFYDRIRDSNICWTNQPEPLGFGHAVLETMPFMADEPFLVHAGDTYLLSEENNLLRRLVNTYESSNAEAVLTLQRVESPSQFGVAEIFDHASTTDVVSVEEKPDHPKSNLAIMPLYLFKPSIFDALRVISPGKGGELQLTDGIQRLINSGNKVRAIILDESDLWLDIGTPETYWDAQRLSYEYFKSRLSP